MSQARVNIPKTREIKNPTYYVEALNGEYAHFAFDEVRAIDFKGHWREKVFAVGESAPLDLEIGTGNGYFFAHRAKLEPTRCLLGLELKFKPLIQSIRRALNQGSKNARMVRYNASFVQNLFNPGEIENVFIHHPDPWTRRRKYKHRLLHRSFLDQLFNLQKAGSFLDFKTDSEDYFLWATEEFKNSPYIIERYTKDLHHSEWSGENYATHFEKIFLAKGQPIYYLRAIKTKEQ